MKLHYSLARYIRRCGYAAGLTLSAGSLLSAQDKAVDYLTHAGNMPEAVSQQAGYTFNLDVRRPDTEGMTPWGTREGSLSIVDAVKNGEAAIKGWCPWRNIYGSPNHNYEIFVPDVKAGEQYTAGVTHDSTTYISFAIRPTIQNELNGVKAQGRQVEEISYIGARSVLPSWEDSSAFTYYTEEDILNGIFNSAGKLVTRTKFMAIYGQDGTQLTDEQGRKLYTDRTSNQYYKKVYADELDVVGTLVELPSHLNEIHTGKVGDNTLGEGRAEIVWTDTPVDVYNNRLIIELSGFSLAVGAYSQYGDVYNNLTYIQDVRVSDDIIAASSYDGDADNNSLVVIRAQAIGQNTTLSDEAAGVLSSNYNNSGKAACVYNGSKVTNDARNNSTFIYGSSIYQDVAGAWTGGDATGNSVFISRSNISTGLQDVDPTRGAYSTRTGTVENNMVIIDDTFDADAAGITPEDLGSTSSAAGGKTATVPDVTTMHDDIQGGASSRAYGDKGAHNNKVIMLGITTPSTDESNKGELVTTTIQGNIFGGVVLNNSHTAADVDYSLPAASATNNTVVLSGVEVQTSSVVPVLRARSPQDNVWGEKYISTDVGRICGGYVGAPRDGRAAGKANDNTVIVMDSRVGNSIYGGSNEGNGEACGNELHLSHVDTTGNDGSYQDRTFYGGWINAYEDGGRGNNNHVWLYGSGWSMDNTFLHGAWGNELAHDTHGDILGAGGDTFIKGAKRFDGTYFYDGSGATLATLQLSNVVRNAADGSSSVIFSDVTAFDGANFYNGSRNNTGTFEEMAIMRLTDSKDIMPSVVDIRANGDGSVDFITDDAKSSVIATFVPERGEIVGTDDVVLAKGIHHYDSSTESFVDKDGKVLYAVARGAIINSSSKIMASGIACYEFDEESGNLEFRSAPSTINGTPNPDSVVLATFVSSTIEGSDSEGNAIDIDIKDSEVDKNGIHMVKRGDINSVFAKIDGYNEYSTYTRGNWLHLQGWQGKLKGFDHFEKLSFVFTDETDLTKPMLTITGPKEDTGLTYTDESGTVRPIDVEVDVSAIAEKLQQGDIIPVIGHEGNGEIAGMDDVPEGAVGGEQRIRKGVTRDITIKTRFKELDSPGDVFDNFGIVEVYERTESATPESKALLEGRIATLAFNNAAGNLVAEQAIESAARAAAAADGEQLGRVPKDELDPGRRLFYVMSGGHTKVDSGSHVNVDGFNALVGIAENVTEDRTLTLGAFMETGWGQYTTLNSYAH